MATWGQIDRVLTWCDRSIQTQSFHHSLLSPAVANEFQYNTAVMGCGMSTEEKEGKQRNEEIENQLKRDKMSQRNEIKMLLLGTLNPLSGCTVKVNSNVLQVPESRESRLS